MQRDYSLAAQLSRAGDDLLIGVTEASAITNLATTTLQQRKVKGFPTPMPGIRKLLWRLGDIRCWMQSNQTKKTGSKRTTAIRG